MPGRDGPEHGDIGELPIGWHGLGFGLVGPAEVVDACGWLLDDPRGHLAGLLVGRIVVGLDSAVADEFGGRAHRHPAGVVAPEWVGVPPFLVLVGHHASLKSACDPNQRGRSPYAELVALGIEHHGPATSVALSELDLRGAEGDEAFDLLLWVLRGQVHVHSALR